MNDEPKKTVLGWFGQDPQYEALKAQFKDKFNMNVQARAARGSQAPLPQDTVAQSTADATVQYAGQHVEQYMQQQMMQTDYGATQQFTPREARQLEQLYDQQVAQYQAAQAGQAVAQYQPGQVVAQYQIEQQQTYDAAAYQYAQQQEQYAQQMAYQQQHEQYAQQHQQQAEAAAYQQQAAAYQQQAEAAAYQQYYAQAQHAQQQSQQQHHDQQVQQQSVAQQQYEQQPAQPNVLGTMAAKLQAQKLKREKASKEAGERGIQGADATVGQSARRRFIKKTYTHLLFAIVAFAGLLFVFRTVEPFPTLLQPFVDFAIGGRWNWGVVLAAYVGVSFVCDQWASHAKSRKMQYLGLGFYVIAEAVIFVPLLAVVAWKTESILASGGGDPNIVRDAAFMTLGTFAFLTLSVLISKKDFSFLRSGLFAASGAAMTMIVLSLMFGFNLGLVFSVGMVVLASGYILMQTSQILAHYDPESHVAASLALFSSLALMFWYMIRIFMRARD